MNNMRSILSRLWHSPISRRAAVSLIVLAWSSFVSCGGNSVGNREIHDAARDDDMEKVEALLKDNPKLAFSKDHLGDTPLHTAAFFGYKDMAELLLTNNADVNAADKDGYVPLHLAASGLSMNGGQKGVAELLLVNKAEVNAKANNGMTPLHAATAVGHKGMAEFLLAKGANVNAKMKDGSTALHLAAIHGDKDLAELLLTDNADVNATAKNGWTPLHTAVVKGHMDVAKLLRQHGAHE